MLRVLRCVSEDLKTVMPWVASCLKATMCREKVNLVLVLLSVSDVIGRNKYQLLLMIELSFGFWLIWLSNCGHCKTNHDGTFTGCGS